MAVEIKLPISLVDNDTDAGLRHIRDRQAIGRFEFDGHRLVGIAQPAVRKSYRILIFPVGVMIPVLDVHHEHKEQNDTTKENKGKISQRQASQGVHWPYCKELANSPQAK